MNSYTKIVYTERNFEVLRPQYLMETLNSYGHSTEVESVFEKLPEWSSTGEKSQGFIHDRYLLLLRMCIQRNPVQLPRRKRNP